MTKMENPNKEKHPITKGVKNYLSMNTSGALLVTGDWGCGKTHYFKNELFKEIISEGSFIPVIVSLFGVNELKEIPERILYAYLDNAKDNVASLGKIAKFTKNFAEALPIVGKYIDVDKLLGSGEGLYKIIPSNVLICLDDIERAIDTIKFNEILGVVNELVENKNYKVIIIANESFIKTDELIFKEKVIEKTFRFMPNVINIFSILVDSHNNRHFYDFMLGDNIKSTINPCDKSIKENKNSWLSKNLSNIRIIKFAIEHFYPIFLHYSEQIGENKDFEDITIKKLRNYWIFILSTSIEYKNNKLSFEDNHGIDSYQATANFDFDDGSIDFEEQEEDEEQRKLKEKTLCDAKYCQQFYKRYFLRLSESPIFHPELYNYITGGIAINYKLLDDYANQKLNIVENAVNPAYELLGNFMNGYWKFTNEEFPKKLKELLNYAQEGQFDDYMAYINTTTYLVGFHAMFELSKQAIISKIKEGIDKYTERVQLNQFIKEHILMVKGQILPDVHPIFEYVLKSIDKKLEDNFKDEIKEIKSLFQNDIEKLSLRFLPKEYNTSPQYFNIPILKEIDSSIIVEKIKTIEPNEAMCLRELIVQRYLSTPLKEVMKEELPFLNYLIAHINKISLDDKKISTFILKKFVHPELEKAIKKLKLL